MAAVVPAPEEAKRLGGCGNSRRWGWKVRVGFQVSSKKPRKNSGFRMVKDCDDKLPRMKLLQMHCLWSICSVHLEGGGKGSLISLHVPFRLFLGDPTRFTICHSIHGAYICLITDAPRSLEWRTLSRYVYRPSSMQFVSSILSWIVAVWASWKFSLHWFGFRGLLSLHHFSGGAKQHWFLGPSRHTSERQGLIAYEEPSRSPEVRRVIGGSDAGVYM